METKLKNKLFKIVPLEGTVFFFYLQHCIGVCTSRFYLFSSSGPILVTDNGTCEVNEYCQPNDEGIATRATDGFRVIKRTGENQVVVLIKPNDDENRKLKRDIAVIEELQKQSVVTMQEYRTQKEESDVKMQALQLENAIISREIKDLKNQLASLMSRLDGSNHP